MVTSASVSSLQMPSLEFFPVWGAVSDMGQRTTRAYCNGRTAAAGFSPPMLPHTRRILYVSSEEPYFSAIQPYVLLHCGRKTLFD